MPYRDPQKQKEWRENHKEYIRIKNKEYRKENKEVISIKRKKRYEDNKEEILQKQKLYRDNNAKEISSRRKKRWADRSIEKVESKKEYAKKWREDNKEHLRNQRLIKEFGIDIDDYNLLLESQNYRCAICKSTETGRKDTEHFSVDHCHKTGKVRGLLCKPCNILLGESKDDPSILYRAADYLMGVKTP